MDNLKLQEEVQSFKKLGEHYESLLRIINFEMRDLPDDVNALLNDCVDLKMSTQLHDLNINYLREFYYTKKRERIENQLIISRQTASLEKLKNEIAGHLEDITELEKFTESVRKRIGSEESLQRNIQMLETKNQGFLDRQKSMKINEDLNIEGLIDKVEMLQQHG